ncbi:hypothetical protein CPELA_03345 [Corynebacterium pelargi]|uniref:Uncharacterized protein n=2 Tax=Corynebacterium pelargi TaxID=1471400 RepID=A0A410W7M5_9CORY|nr:hypothetical protein CPELA_03345 [Corynebacterium pelargi]
MALGWRPEDIHHVQGLWPPRIEGIPEGITPAIALAWACYHRSGVMHPVRTPLVDAPLLAPQTPFTSKQSARLTKLIHHARHSSNAHEAHAYHLMSQNIARQWNLSPDVFACLCSLEPPTPRCIARRVLLQGPSQQFDGHMLRHLGLGAGVLVAQVHPSGIWSLLGRGPAIQRILKEFRFLQRNRWPGAEGLDHAQAYSFCAGVCASGTSPPKPQRACYPQPEPRTPISGELGKVIAKMRLVDQQHRAHRLLPGWYEMGVKWKCAIKHSRAMLVELQA